MSPRRSAKLEEYQRLLDEAIRMLDRISQDRGVPRNIRRLTTEAIDVLRGENSSHAVRASKAISMLNEVMGDINMPPQTRSQMLLVIGLLERIKD